MQPDRANAYKVHIPILASMYYLVLHLIYTVMPAGNAMYIIAP